MAKISGWRLSNRVAYKKVCTKKTMLMTSLSLPVRNCDVVLYSRINGDVLFLRFSYPPKLSEILHFVKLSKFWNSLHITHLPFLFGTRKQKWGRPGFRPLFCRLLESFVGLITYCQFWIAIGEIIFDFWPIWYCY